MGFLSIYNKTERIPIKIGELADGEDWWVEVRQVLPKRDYDAAQRLLGTEKMRISSGGSATTTMDFGNYQMELVARSIVQWNLTDDNDVVLPLGKDVHASLDRLPQAAFLAIYRRVNELNSPREEKEKDSFRSSTNGGHPSGEDVESDLDASVA